MDQRAIKKAVRQWLESIVIDLNLCPFARKAYIKNAVRLTVTEVTQEEQLLEVLYDELKLLQLDSSVETTLLIHPFVLDDFEAYNQFLGIIDEFLDQLKLEGIFQVASFHPQYQFAGTDVDDVENYTNRAPYPILHILREESLDSAIDSYPNIDQVPENNIRLMKEMGLEKMQELLKKCLQ